MLSNLLGTICPQSYCFCALIENLFNSLLLQLGNISDTFVSGMYTGLATRPSEGLWFSERNSQINKQLKHSVISDTTAKNPRMMVEYKRQFASRLCLQQKISRECDQAAK